MSKKKSPPSIGQFALSERDGLLAKITEQAREIERLAANAARYAFVKNMTREMLLAWRDIYAFSDAAIDAATRKRKLRWAFRQHGYKPMLSAAPAPTVEPAHSDAVSVPTFCAYCGGNDEDPQDHCTDCTEPLPVPRSFLEELDDALTVHIELLNVNDYEPDDVVIAEQRRSDLRALLAGGEV
jgi:hypothetical protein